MTTTLRVPALLLAALALAGACQSPAHAPVSPSPSPTPPAARALTTCFTAAPAAWAGAQRASLRTALFSLAAVTPAGDRAFGLVGTTGQLGIGALDLATGSLTRVVTLPAGAAGFSALAADPPWLAWAQANSSANLGAWTLEARNLDTGEQVTVATPGLAEGGAPTALVVSKGRVAWAQSTSGVLHTAELRVYDLAAHRQTVLDPAAAGEPVLAGRYLVWGHAGAGFQAVDAATLQPADLPDRVRSQTPDAAVAGSANELVWGTDEQHFVAWRIDRDQLTTYTLAIGDTRHRLQFLTVAGHFLMWFTSVEYAILDLDTGGGYDVALPGAVAGSEGTIVRTSSPDGGPKGPGATTVVSVLATASAPAIPGCAGR